MRWTPALVRCCSDYPSALDEPASHSWRRYRVTVISRGLFKPWLTTTGLTMIDAAAGHGKTWLRVLRPPGGNKKFADNPMKRDFATRPRESVRTTSTCGAQTRIGTLCRRPPVVGRKRCRLHGGLSPGAPRGFKNGNYKTGDWTTEAIAEPEWLRSLIQSFTKIGVVG